MSRRIPLALLAASIGCAAPDPAPYAGAAVAVGRWLEATGLATEDGTSWLPVPAARQGAPRLDLYHGAAGVCLFLAELYRRTGEQRWLSLASAAADDLVARLPEEPTGSEAGLYTGLAGIGFVLQHMHELTQEAAYELGARGCVAALHESARQHAGGVDWNDTTDIIRGGAGIALFLLWYAERTQDESSAALAEKAGRRLLRLARPAEGGLDWPMTPTSARRMPNFSHGTAGVCFFLARLYDVTHKEEYLRAALKGANYLVSIGEGRDGFRAFHHAPGGEQLFYLGWCHGPVGTARLFYELYKVTSDGRWLEWTRRCASSVLASGIPERQTPGFWNNVGVCCGSAGVADFFLDLHRITQAPEYLRFAVRTTDDLLARGTSDASGLHWVQAEHRVRPDLLQAQTGYMQGAAGIGLWLLKLDAQLADRHWPLVLPDSPFAPF